MPPAIHPEAPAPEGARPSGLELPQAPVDTASPIRAVVLVVLSVLTAEALSVWFGTQIVANIGFLHGLLDCVIILALTLPLLLWLFLRPLRRAFEETALARASMQDRCRELEASMLDRTAMLERLNQSLGRSEAKYSSLVENSPTGIFILQGGRIVFGNNLFFEMIGLSKQETTDLDPIPWVHPDDLTTVRQIWKRQDANEGTLGDCDYRIITATGALRWVRCRATPMKSSEGTSLLCNIQDITERYQAEKNFKESREALRLLSARLLTVQEEDRKRVAQDLHDGIGQSLSAVKFMVERALKGACSEPKGCHMEVLKSVVPVLQQSVEETRRICMGLRPSTLDDLGLIATLKWFCREFQISSPQVQVDLTIGLEESQIPDQLKTNIFRIIQESMNNVAKHARAHRVAIDFCPSEGQLTLTIEDDGVGFDTTRRKETDRSGGLGLASMRERAEQCDGTLWIASAPGRGTRLTVKWPLIDAPDFVEKFYSRAWM